MKKLTQSLSMSGNLTESGETPNKLTRFAFYGTVCAFPWETLPIGLGENFSLAKVAGLIFFGVALLQPRVCFRFPPFAFWLFLLYLGFYGLVAIGGDAKYDRSILMKGFSNVQMIVLFWMAYNVLHDKKAVKGFLLAFIGACLSLVVGGLFMEGVTGGMKAGDQERLVTLGVDPNTTGATFALGLMATMGLAYGRQNPHLQIKLFAGLPFLIMAAFLIKTGSRGAMLAFIIGISFLLVKGGNIRAKLGLTVIVILGLGALIGLSLNTSMAERFERSLSKGDTAGREVVYLEGAGMVNEKPLTGWGPLRYRYELANRIGEYGKEKDPHNLILKLLLEVGILGASPFFLGLGLCFRAAWKARDGLEGSLPISMFVTLLMINMSLTWENRKIFWIILAYSLVSIRHVLRVKKSDAGASSAQFRDLGTRNIKHQTSRPKYANHIS